MAGTDASLADLVAQFSADYAMESLIAMASVTLFGGVGALALKRVSERAAAQFMALPIYLCVFPGMAASTIVAYLLFFARQNLFTTPGAALLLVPPVWMFFSLLLFSRLIDFDEVPGFDRLRGLMGLAALSFITALILDRFRFVVFGRIGPGGMLGVVAVLFVGFQVFFRKAFGAPRE